MRNRLFISALLAAVPALALPSAGAEIHDAVKAGDLARVRTIVESDPALVDARDENGRTPLHWAARGTDDRIIAFLAERGADVNALDGSGIAPLHSLASRGNVEGIRILLEKRALVDIAAPDKKTALHFAALGRHEDVLKCLAERGATLEVRDDYGRTPLVVAAREMAGLAVVKTLLDLGANVDAADRFEDTAVTLAAWRGSREVVDLLLERKADLPTDPGKTGQVLESAASNGLSGLFSRLVARGADVSAEKEGGRTLLHVAAEGGSIPVLKALASKGLDVNRQDAFGWAPLHFAADLGRTEAIDWLVCRGAGIEARTAMGQSAYNIAEDNGDRGTMDFLAAKGFDRGPARFPVLAGEYLGQAPPGKTPRLFAPGIVSARYGLHSNVIFSPDRREAFWTVMIPPRGEAYGGNRTLVSRLEGGRWTYPREAVFDGVELEDVPFYHPRGGKLFDMARRAVPGGAADRKENIWTWDKGPGGWTNPRPLDATVNDLPHHWQFSVDRDGTLYFSTNVPGSVGERDIYVSRPVGGRYGVPENLGAPVNSPAGEEFPFVAPDGRYLLFGRDMDIYVSFRGEDGTWGQPRPLGPEVNTPDLENLPMVSPGGKYLFFSRYQLIFWVDASVIEDARAKEAK